MTRRLVLAAFAAATLTQTGCCGRVRAFFYRITHPCGGIGCCAPAFGGYADGPPAVPAYAAGPAPVFAGGPGCATCYSGPPAEAVPVGGFPVVPPPGFPMGGIVQGVPQQMAPPSGGPGVFGTPAEPPTAGKK